MSNQRRRCNKHHLCIDTLDRLAIGRSDFDPNAIASHVPRIPKFITCTWLYSGAMAYYFLFKWIQRRAETETNPRNTKRCLPHSAPCYVLFGHCPLRNLQGAIKTTAPQISNVGYREFCAPPFSPQPRFETRCLIFVSMTLWNRITDIISSFHLDSRSNLSV